MERSFWHESAALYRYRDVLCKAAADAAGLNMPRSFRIIPGADILEGLEPAPEVPQIIKEALSDVNERIARLQIEHYEIHERRRHQ